MLMSTAEAKAHEFGSTKSSVKCRIPQRLSSARPRPSPSRPKPVNDVIGGNRPRHDLAPVTQVRYGPRTSTPRPKSTESRPKSGNRVKEDWASDKNGPHSGPQFSRPNFDRKLPISKRASTLPRKGINERRFVRPIITVPVMQRLHRTANNCDLPDQETIQQHETLELQNELYDSGSDHDIAEADSLQSSNDQAMQLKIKWQENMVMYEKMKSELGERQKDLITLYAKMRNTHKKLSVSGHSVCLPPAEELRIINVYKLTPEQLLQICSLRHTDDKCVKGDAKSIPLIDTTKLYNTQKKLVATCEQTLNKRREFINWFETLRCEEKSIRMRVLAKRTNEFSAETEMLQSSMERAKEEMAKEIKEVVDFVRNKLNETMALQMRTEELTFKLTELNSNNSDLRKQIQTLEHLKSTTNRDKLKELEKELKEERCKKLLLQEKLGKTEGQVKIENERAAQLEVSLEHCDRQCWSLQTTVKQLHEQNEKLKHDFDTELTKLRMSIKENTINLEEIANDREKLQIEKEDLEKRLEELSTNYNESIASIKHGAQINVAKLIEAGEKYEVVVEEKKRLQSTVESITNKLMEAETNIKDLKMQLQERDQKILDAESYQNELRKIIRDKEIIVEEAQSYQNDLKNQIEEREKILGIAMTYEKQLQSTKQDLDVALMQIEDCKIQMSKQNDIISELKRTAEESHKLEDKLKISLSTKEEYVAELEKKQLLLEKQLQDSDIKMESYVQQLSSLKNNINQLKEEVGEFGTLNELRDIVIKQRAKLTELSNQNDDLTEALQKKEAELDQHLENISKQEQLLQQRDDIIKMLSEKAEEHTKIIKLLRDNLEMRTDADISLNQQIIDKNEEIESLLTNIEKRKQQLLETEKIILALEEQSHKSNLQKMKYEERIKLLEQKIMEYEAYHMDNRPPNNLDSLIKILEDELGTSLDESKKKYAGDRNENKVELFEFHKGNNQNPFQSNAETLPTKIVMGNFVKKTYVPTGDDKYRRDILDRKQAITNIDTQKYGSVCEPGLNTYAVAPVIKDNNYPPFRGLIPAGSHIQDNLLSRNMQYLTSSQLRGDKKSRMFKFAGHRI